MPRVEDRLRDAEAPDGAAAAERARHLVLTAAAELEPVRVRRSRRGLVAVAVLIVAVVVAALAVTPPGDAVARWFSSLVGTSPKPSSPSPRLSLTAVPGGGRLLVTGPGGAWVVHADGSRRRLGPYANAAWSPHGLFVAVTRGRSLLAVEPDGDVRWALARDEPIHDPRWQPTTGYRIAYRTSGAIRVVAGDGSGDHPLVDRAAPVPPAWRPGVANELAVVRAGGAVELWLADSRVRVWRRAGVEVPLAVGWRGDDRIVVVRRHGLVVLDARGHRIPGPGLPTDIDRAAISPDGRRVAVAAGADVTVLPVSGHGRRTRVTAASPVGSLTWSSDGRRLLVGAPAADQWLFVPSAGHSGVVAVADVARQFDPSHRRARGAPVPTGWCCVSPRATPGFDPGRRAPGMRFGNTRVSPAQRPHGTCAVGRTAWASTVPFLDGPRTLPPALTVRTLASGDALVAIVAFSDHCRGEPGGTRRARPPLLRLVDARRQDWPGRVAGDPPLLRITTRAPGRYSIDAWIFARGTAGRATARRMLRSIRWPAKLR